MNAGPDRDDRDDHDDHDDYLWDGRGDPDPLVERLERVLRPLGRPGPAAAAPVPGPDAAATAVASPGSPGRSWRRSWRESWRRSAIAAAATAAAALVLVVSLVVVLGREFADGRPTVYEAVSETRRVDLPGLGHVDLFPGARLSEIASGPERRRLFLERGKVRALVSAPPRVFGIATPAGDAIDLGCLYTVEVGEDGDSELAVIAGHVSFEDGGRAVRVPAGFRCRARKAGRGERGGRGAGPGTPVRIEADPILVSAIDAIDEGRLDGDHDVDHDGDPVAGLESAGRQDARTLWVLLVHPRADVRRAAAARLEALEGLPPGWTPEAAADGTRETRRAWAWHLGLD